MYTKFQVHISKHVQKNLVNFLLAESSAEFSLPSVFGPQKARNWLTMLKTNTDQDTYYKSVCAESL